MSFVSGANWQRLSVHWIFHFLVLVWQFIEESEEVLHLGKGYSQYYATVDLGATRVGRTRVLEGQPRDPVWNESFLIYCAHSISQVVISIKDAAIPGTTVIGRAKVPAIELLSGLIDLTYSVETGTNLLVFILSFIYSFLYSIVIS